MKGIPDHTDLPCKWLTSLLIKEIRMEGLSGLGWLNGVVKHAIWTDVQSTLLRAWLCLQESTHYQHIPLIFTNKGQPFL